MNFSKNDIAAIYINDTGEDKMAENKKRAGKKDRSMKNISLENAIKNMPSAKYIGYPDNFMSVIFRFYTEGEDRMFRSMDVGKVKGGGCIVQSSWYENGQIGVTMIYDENLQLSKVRFQDDEGHEKIGYRLTARRFTFWKKLLRSVFGI
ncbi:MAG: hypothetical protein GY749_21475 [Desulfobacteraceae bacterium]|nr:hypothetical protein [Desulfobacteraceae bacterium]